LTAFFFILAWTTTTLDGDYGVYFDGHLTYLNDTTVTVGNLRVNDNYYDDQNKAAIYVEDYYYAEYWEGTTTASFGDLEFNGNGDIFRRVGV
jgi:hypothetical protein